MPLGTPVETFERRRRDTTGSVDPSTGRWSKGNLSTTEYEGTVQSVSAETVETLSEGDRHRAEYDHWTDADLRGDDQYDDVPGDRVERKKTGAVYEVRTVTDVGDLSADERYVLLRIQES
jgi:hypothetical protein